MSTLILITNFLTLFFTPNLSLANVVSSGDVPYYKIKKDDYQYIYPDEFRNYMPDLITTNEMVKNLYQKEFNWQLDEKTSLVLASNNNQIVNAYATVIPNNLTLWYPAGSEGIDYFAFRSWPLGLLLHETAHLYQLDTKSELAKFSKAIFGNNPVTLLPVPVPVSPFFFFPLPVLTFPNALLPTWIIEGNAVFNESRFGNGGRLYSGPARAMFLSLLKANILNEERLTNNHIAFPFGQEKYIVGGYFSLFLASRFGVEKLNHFFKQHSVHYFNPLRLNSSFNKHFASSYSDNVERFLDSWRKTALEQRELLEGDILARSLVYSPLNRQDGEILFLSNSHLTSASTLNILNTNQGKFESRILDLPNGKVYKWKGQYLSNSSQPVSRDKNIFSLWDDSRNRLEEFDNLVINDMQPGRLLKTPLNQSFIHPEIYLNDKAVVSAHSQALLGPDGSVYTFVQESNKRWLVKNGQKLMSYQGYFGRVVDISNSGQVYFIASTKTGSSLFCFDKGMTFRMSNADTIVDAKISGPDEFVLVQVTASGYEYRKVALKTRTPQVPFYYYYFFANAPEMNWTDQLVTRNSAMIKNQIPQKAQTSNILEEESSYNSITSLRFNSWQGIHLHDDTDGARTMIDAHFSDPLNYNIFSLSANWDGGKDHRDTFSALYYNTKYRVNWGILGRYRDLQPHALASTVKRKDDWRGEFLLGYHLWRTGRWNLTGNAFIGVERAYHTKTDYYLRLKLARLRQYSLNLYPHDLFNLQGEGYDEKEGQSATLMSNASYDLGREFYITSSYVGAFTNSSELTLANTIDGEGPLVPSSISRITLYGQRPHYDFYSHNLGLMFNKVIGTSLYSKSFPLGLRRISPAIMGNTTTVKTETSNIKVYDLGFGLNSEVLMFHLAPITFGVNYFKRYNYQEDTTVIFRLLAQY